MENMIDLYASDIASGKIMEFIEFCFLAMTYLISRSNSFEIIPNGTAWLGESIALSTSEIPDMKRPIVWRSKNYKYECDRTCASGEYTVTQDGNTSTLIIKSISWEFSKWSFTDDNLNGAKLELDIKVKPKLEIKVIRNCIYNVTAQCSLPATRIECYIRKIPTEFIAIQRNTCPDGKTVTNDVILNVSSSATGKVECIFTMKDLFKEKRFIDFQCAASPGVKTDDDTDSGFYIFRPCTNLLLGIIIALIIFKN
ncbi:Hypothetical predicted protein [Octopus vulgaris]|uniref:Uncharacterized protein n=1 Tax=Octopus vulgaris TaxID=6645 RepID=A0AA36AUC6_OCTVU|nr:Hypothetical predicted protein [Octopus vulgaris]